MWEVKLLSAKEPLTHHRNQHPAVEEKQPYPRKRSRSRENEGGMQAVLQRERERAAAARKGEVSARPQSYKSSLSVSMPSGTVRQRDNRIHREEQFVSLENPKEVVTKV